LVSGEQAGRQLQFPAPASDNRRRHRILDFWRCTMRLALLLALTLFPALALAHAAAQEKGPVVSPAQAARLLDKRIVLQMEVKSTGGSVNCYLNSAVDFKDAANFAVFIPQAALDKFKQARIENPKAFYKGKTVQVNGTVTLYEEKPQIRVDDPTQIKVVVAERK
jgi:hypothetical protein